MAVTAATTEVVECNIGILTLVAGMGLNWSV